MKETKNPKRLENCLRSMLYDYQYKDDRDFFICELSNIKKAVNKCVQGFNEMKKGKYSGSKTDRKKNQSGGGKKRRGIKYTILKQINNMKKQVASYDKKINKLNNKIYNE